MVVEVPTEDKNDCSLSAGQRSQQKSTLNLSDHIWEQMYFFVVKCVKKYVLIGKSNNGL